MAVTRPRMRASSRSSSARTAVPKATTVNRPAPSDAVDSCRRTGMPGDSNAGTPAAPPKAKVAPPMRRVRATPSTELILPRRCQDTATSTGSMRVASRPPDAASSLP